ncbi:tRNA epoxyqueuosine(34) reductase QueG [Acanthopleuribacter pedis]|uniref:tRNA epoxyqueuosine(34) reductase QueG n=1 Tax=Acanthopleuribacter pedis TaxID=442870 RepID=A0A8J7Q9P5_9BACT|nr:tRNA epoxyqueuosine(34) reductase QueG [Acanthopleuribacter pedis]MBO1316976.1 tRNA epoxyqueuosine(34) reductase QueG [Acanthopleuribacter pedis]
MEHALDSPAWAAFRQFVLSLGFSDVAAAPVQPVKRAQAVKDWVAAGHHADMHWYARGLEKRLDPRLVVPEARSIIVLTMPYHPEPVTLAGKKLARYACGDDYHDVILKKLKLCTAWLSERVPDSATRHYVDTGPVLERYWAQESGLGWIGKNGNLISRREGSYLFLASMVTTLRVPYGTPHLDFCGSCRACIDACPTDAIVADGVVDARKCISYLTIEHRGPFEDAPDFSDWLFGCDICQEVCPWPNKFSQPTAEPAFLPREAYGELTEEGLAAMEQADFSATFRKSPIKRTKIAGIQRNLEHLQSKNE